MCIRDSVIVPLDFEIRPYVVGEFITPGTMLQIHPFESTDLATIPWYLQWLVKKHGKHNLPTVLHDYLLQHRDLFPELTRKQIDQIFREAMIDKGVPERDCRVIYNGVRCYATIMRKK